MSDCPSIDPLVTPYVDGELTGAALVTIERHIRLCPACHSRVTAERAVRGLLKARQGAFKGECASATLRARCASHRGACLILPPAEGARSQGRRAFPWAVAAALLVAVSGGVLYTATGRSDRLMAAELAADHLKCFTLNAALNTHDSAETVEHALASGFEWNIKLPAELERDGFELVGSRPCLYGGGRIAHVMYRHHGQPVSVFMLPGTVRREGIIEALGHECVVWSDGARTFALVARETRADVERLALLARATFH